ncbi:MAG: hypothetical protein U0992_17665 [Planctomycetaceae bacterium]
MAAKPALPPLVKPKDALTLEVHFIELGAGDPLLGDLLWKQLDETAVKSPAVRARLRSAGLRVGLAGSNAPPGLRAAASDQQNDTAAKGVQIIPLLAGQESNLETAFLADEFLLRTRGTDGDILRTYQGARCVFRVSGEREQEGWVRLHVKPELHHGTESILPAVAAGEWKLQKGQRIDHLLEQNFEVELNLGELLVIGALGREEDTIGGRFFRSGSPPAAKERVLVIRVADVQQVDAVRTNDF